MIVAGVFFLVDSFVRFARDGLGTPAPIMPTEHLVVGGLYRYVRNPMYVGIASAIFGQAMYFGDTQLLLYGAIVWLAFHLFVLVYEEPTLRRTFGYAFVPEEERNSLHSCPDLEFAPIGLEPFDLLGMTIRPIRLIHGHLPVLGFRMKNVAFCTDCSFIPDESWPLLEGLDVLILDALWEEPHPTHFSVPQALEVIAKVRPQQAYLTHISHRLEHVATNARLPEHVELAYDGLRIPI